MKLIYFGGKKNSKSNYFSDPKVRKFVIISNIFLIMAALGFVLLFFIWKDEYSEVSFDGPSSLLSMPFIYILGLIFLVIIGSIFRYIAVGKNIIHEVKNDDSTFIDD